MPQFKIAKTDNINILNNKETVEDKLYIYKETDKLGRLFYDFKDGTRIEIGSLDNVYQCTDNLTEDVCNVDITKLRKYLANNTLSDVNTNEIKINSLVTSFKSLYNIRNIKRVVSGDTTTTTITLRKIYEQQDLKWNDYYND